LPTPVTLTYCSTPGDLIFRVDASEFAPYSRGSASDSPLARVTSPPAPVGWNLPAFAPGGLWRPSSQVWWDVWSAPGWNPLPQGCAVLGLRASQGAAEGKDGTTHLLRHAFVLSAPGPGFYITRAWLEPWSDNKSEWWWEGKLLLTDRQGSLGAIDLFPTHVSRVGGRYLLAVQSSNDYVCPDNDLCNPHGVAFRLSVTWSYGVGSGVYLPVIVRKMRM